MAERCADCGPGYRKGDEGCRHSQPTAHDPALREAIADFLWDGNSEEARADADALLAGPLAPLVAKAAERDEAMAVARLAGDPVAVREVLAERDAWREAAGRAESQALVFREKRDEAVAAVEQWRIPKPRTQTADHRDRWGTECAYCGKRVQRVNYSLSGPTWMHVTGNGEIADQSCGYGPVATPAALDPGDAHA